MYLCTRTPRRANRINLDLDLDLGNAEKNPVTLVDPVVLSERQYCRAVGSLQIFKVLR